MGALTSEQIAKLEKAVEYILKKIDPHRDWEIGAIVSYNTRSFVIRVEEY